MNHPEKVCYSFQIGLSFSNKKGDTYAKRQQLLNQEGKRVDY